MVHTFRKSYGISWQMPKELSGNTIPILVMRATDMAEDGTINVGS
jgi:hypothetical protein